MPDSIDWPRMSPSRHRRRFLLSLVILAGIVFGGRAALSYYVDALWFGSLGYGDVFWKTLTLQWGIFTAFAAATFLILYGSFLALKRTHLPDLPDSHTILFGGQPLKLPVAPVLRLIALAFLLPIATSTGAPMMAGGPTPRPLLYPPPATAGLPPAVPRHGGRLGVPLGRGSGRPHQLHSGAGCRGRAELRRLAFGGAQPARCG